MGWWKTGQNDDVIGDRPADIMSSTFEVIARAWGEAMGRRPTLREVLNALAVLLRQKPEAYLADTPRTSIRRFVARMGNESTEVGGSEDEHADQKLVAALADAFEAIAVEYEDSVMERKPRLSELLATLVFVLSYRPEDYLSDANGISIQAIVPDRD